MTHSLCVQDDFLNKTDGSNLTILKKTPYFIGLGRAMVSLGPITSDRYCPYNCRFCYVQGPFPKYPSTSVEQIVPWLANQRTQFDIVYVSGDTDSFAPPRTNHGLDLLQGLLDLEIDVLFTTRTVFNASDGNRLRMIASEYRKKRLLLIGCISISQLHHPELEPPPIPSPSCRANQLQGLHESGLVTALTIRPFIPSIPASEYCDIATLGHSHADVILGGDLYLDSDGVIQQSIQKATTRSSIELSKARYDELDFSLGKDRWTIVHHPDAVREVSRFSQEAGKPFFMRSTPAVDWIRSQRTLFLER